MLALEPTHTISLIDKFFAYIADAGILAIVLALAYVFSYVIAIIICKNSKKDNDKSNPKFYSKDYSVAALSQMLGKNIVDTQVDELQKIIHYIKTNQKKKHIHLIAEGRLCYLARLISLSKENPFETIIRINDTNFSPINLYHFPMKKEQATLVIMP